MGYTQTDLDNIDKAIMDLTLGNRVETISIGGDTTSFAAGVTMTQLQQMRTVVARSLGLVHSRTFASNGGRG